MHLNCILRRIIALFIALAILAGCDRDCDCHNEPVPEAADSERIEFRVFPMAYFTPESSLQSGKTLQETFSNLKTPSGAIVYEKRFNAFVVRDTKQALDKMQRFIDATDVWSEQSRTDWLKQRAGKTGF